MAVEAIGTIQTLMGEKKLYALNMGRAKIAAALMRSVATDGVDHPEIALDVFTKIVALSIQRGETSVDYAWADEYIEGSQQDEIVQAAMLVMKASGFKLGNVPPASPAPATDSTGTESIPSSSSAQDGPGNTSTTG